MSTTADLNDYSSRVNITGVTIASIPIDIVAQTVGAIAISIDAIDVTGNIPIDISAQSMVGDLRIDVSSQSMVGNITVDISAQSMVGNLNVNLAASAIVVNMNISSITGGVTFDVNITGSVAINVNATQIGVWNVNATEVGVWNVNANITGSVAINVNVTGSVAIDIKTSGGVNIIIDKLEQGAYTERRSTLSNNGPTPLYSVLTGNNRMGKFFPRGARGFINTIDAYCKDDGAAGGTITIYLSPHIGMGYVASATITVPASGAPAWRSATFNRMWNYDSLFIFGVSSSADVKVGTEDGTPHDKYYSGDAGATWFSMDGRWWLRAIMKGETVGDIPVSGTINNVEIPSTTTRVEESAVMCNTGVYTPIVTIHGAGKLVDCQIYFNTTVVPAVGIVYYIRLEADGVLIYDIDNRRITQSLDAAFGRCSIGEFLQADGETLITLHLPFSFKRSLRLIGLQSSGANVTAVGRIFANLIS